MCLKASQQISPEVEVTLQVTIRCLIWIMGTKPGSSGTVASILLSRQSRLKICFLKIIYTQDIQWKKAWTVLFLAKQPWQTQEKQIKTVDWKSVLFLRNHPNIDLSIQFRCPWNPLEYKLYNTSHVYPKTVRCFSWKAKWKIKIQSSSSDLTR